MFHEMAVTIVLAIVLSGVVAIVVSPMVCARLLRKAESENRYQRRFNKARSPSPSPKAGAARYRPR